jgi:hypothetical protein
MLAWPGRRLPAYPGQIDAKRGNPGADGRDRSRRGLEPVLAERREVEREVDSSE